MPDRNAHGRAGLSHKWPLRPLPKHRTMEVLGMKLQRIETKCLGKTYAKYQIVIPTDIVKQAGWLPKDSIRFALDRNGRVIMYVDNATCTSSKRMSYDEMCTEVTRVLVSVPEGLAWSEIRKTAPCLPIKPSAFWVRRMEGDIGLVRETEAKTYRKIWKLRPMLQPAILT